MRRSLAAALVGLALTACGRAVENLPAAPGYDAAAETHGPAAEAQVPESGNTVKALSVSTGATRVQDPAAAGGDAVLLPARGTAATFTTSATLQAGTYRLVLMARADDGTTSTVTLSGSAGILGSVSPKGGRYTSSSFGQVALAPGRSYTLTLTSDQRAYLDYLVLNRTGDTAEPTPAPGNTVGDLYVSATAAAGGDGSSARPYRTIQAAIDAAAAGQTVVVRPGTYRESINVTKANLKLLGESGAVVSGADVAAGWLREGAYWTLPYTPAAGVGAWIDGWQVCDDAVPQCGKPDQVFMDGQELWQENRLDWVDTPNDFYVGPDRIYLAADPTGRTVEVSRRAYWLKGFADGVTVQGISFRAAANKAQGGAAFDVNYRSGWVVRGNEMAHAAAANLDMSGSNVTVEENDIHNAGQLGVTGNAKGSRFSRNKLRDNNVAGFNVQWEAGGSKWHQGSADPWNPPYQGVTISDNDVYGNYGPGIWVDVWGNGYTITGNRIRHNKHQGINYELSKNALIEGNTIWSNGFNLGYDGQAPTSTIVPPHWALGAGVYILQSDDVTIRNNLIAYNADGVTVWSDSRWDHTVSGIVVTGNDILTRQNAGSAHAIAWLTTREHAGAPQGVLGAGNRGENNRFYMEGGASLVWNNQYFPDVVSFGSTPGGIGSSLISPATATALTSGLTGI